jgi:hypothetical protein
MFGMPKVWVSDKGTHFVNGVIAELARFTGSKCEYILAYCHWRNGSVERVNRDLLQAFKAIIAETKLEIEQWTEIVLTVMCVLNHTISQSLAGKTAIECFTALKPASVVDLFFLLEELAKPTMHELQHCADEIQQLQESLANIHLEIADIEDHRRITSQMVKRGVQFEKGCSIRKFYH